MPRLVSCKITDREDGRFDVIATLEPNRVYRRDGFVSLAEADEWVAGLRALMAALGAPVVVDEDDARDWRRASSIPAREVEEGGADG